MHCDTGKVNHASVISWEMYHSTCEVYHGRCITIHVKYMYDVSHPDKSMALASFFSIPKSHYTNHRWIP